MEFYAEFLKVLGRAVRMGSGQVELYLHEKNSWRFCGFDALGNAGFSLE